MDPVPAWAYVIVVLGYLGAVAGTDLWFMRRAARRVRDAFPETWAKIGATSLMSWNFGWWARFKGYRELHDPELDQLFRVKHRFDTLSFAVFALLAIGMHNGVLWPWKR